MLYPPPVKRKCSDTKTGNRDESPQRTEVRASVVHRSPEALLEEHLHLGRRAGNEDVDE